MAAGVAAAAGSAIVQGVGMAANAQAPRYPRYAPRPLVTITNGATVTRYSTDEVLV